MPSMHLKKQDRLFLYDTLTGIVSVAYEVAHSRNTQ